MSYGNLADFWQRFGVTMGDDAGRHSVSSGSMVEDLGEQPNGETIEGQTSSTLNTLEQELQQLVDRFVSSLEEKNWKDSGKYISDVYACDSPERAEALARRLAERATSFRRGLIGISIHGDHVHSIHSCPYTSNTCRCFFKNFPEAKEDIRRLLRKPRALETFNRRDWENITKYFCTNQRRATFFKVFGQIQRIPPQISALSDTAIRIKNAGEQDTSVDNCSDPLNDNDRSERSDIPAHSRVKRRRQRRDPIVLGGDGGIGGPRGLILNFLSYIAVNPITELVHTKEYLQSPLAIYRLDSREVKDAMDTWASTVNTWSRADYVKFYDNPKTIKIWSARSIDDFDTYYYSYEDSCAVINRLLEYQMGQKIDEFCTNLIDVLERRVPKRNCFVVVSPPSAGKNFFFDAIRDYYLNTGQMNNPNKYNQFAYQDCTNRRVLFWNEPNYEPRETENLKLLFGGDNMSANVKCKPQANVKRTPVIVTSNYMPNFARQGVFADRIVTYHWTNANFLKEYDKKPIPTAVMDVIYSYIKE